MTRTYLLAMAAVLVAASLAAAQPRPPLPPRPFSGRPDRGPTRPSFPPGEAARVEEEIEGAARVAILNLDRSSLGALVEAALRDKKMVNWWPRGATARLLADAQFHIGVDLPPPAQESTERPPLPDAIVIIWTQVGGDARQAEVVVCEPGLGLRLGAKQVALAGEPAKDVAALADAATSGLKKLGEKMRQLWAVPPFHSSDLLTSKANLRDSLAREAEQVLLSQSGTFLVELEYAHVLAAARRIAGIEQGLTRSLPRFLIGAYRHENEGLALSLGVRDDASAGETRQLPAAAPDKAIAALREQLVQVAKGSGAMQATDPSAEMNLIAAISRDYQKEGNWNAALSLAEARLLLDPSDRQWRSLAIGHATKAVRDQLAAARRLAPTTEETPGPRIGPPANTRPTRPLPPTYKRAVMETLSIYRRAMRHFERQITTNPAAESRGTHAWLPSPGHDFVHTQLAFSQSATDDPELAAVLRDFRRQRQSLILKYNEIAAANGEAGDMIIFSELPLEERRALATRMIVDFRLYPRAEMRNRTYLNAAFSYQGGRENAEAFLAELATLSDPTIQKAVEQQRQRMAQMAAAARQPAANDAHPMAAVRGPARAPAAPDPDAQIAFTPLALPWKNVPDHVEARSVCELVLPLGKAGDLFCHRGQILLSKKKGEYKLVWESGQNQMFRHMTSAGYGPALACFDGKYGWVPLVDPGKPARLLVIDPASEKVTEVTAQEGLPAEVAPASGNALLAATALAPGKAFLAGSFGRSWLGIATFEADKGAEVKVIHEARDLPVAGERDQHLSANLAFDPIWIFNLRGKSEEGKPIERVLVGRYAIDSNAHPFPLVIDPDSGKVEVAATPLATSSDLWPVQFEGSLYWSRPWYMGAARGQEIWRLSLPDLTPQSLAKKPFTGDQQYVTVGMEEGRVHLVEGNAWHTATSWDETLEALRGQVPGQPYERRAPIRSEIHGWLMHSATESRVHQVEFREK